MHTEFRQGIISYPSSLGEQTFLVVSGSYISLIPNNQLSITFAFGEENYLLVESTNVTNAWGPLLINTDYWLYWDINRTTGLRTFGTTLVAPVVSTTEPIPVNNLHWFNPDTQKMYVYQYSTWREKVRVFAAKVNNGVFTPLGSSLYAGTQVGLDDQHTISGRIVVNSLGKTIIRQNGTLLTSDSNTFLNGSYTNVVRPEAQIVYGQATEHIDPFLIVKLTNNGQMSIANYNDTHVSALAVTMQTSLLGQTSLLCVRGVISNPNWNFTEIGIPLWVGASGSLTEVNPFTIDPTTYPTNKPPVANVLTANSVYFNPSMGGRGLDGPAASVTPLSTELVHGRAKLSVAPTNPEDPIWVGTNDPRLVQYNHPATHPASIITTDSYSILTGPTLDVQLQQLINRSLDSLVDVVVPTPATNAFLTYNGTNWIATALTATPYMDDLLDVTISAVTAGQILVYNGVEWENSDLPTITLTTDATGSGTTTLATTLATVNSNVGTFGNDTTVPQITVNAKGLITAVTQVAIASPPGGGNITSVALSGGTTAFTFSNSPITTTGVFGMSGDLSIPHGGTSANTANTAFNNLAPSQLGNTDEFLTTDGTNTNWDVIYDRAPHTLTMWGSGDNTYGQIAADTRKSSPVQVGSHTDWAILDLGRRFAAALKIDRTLWTWGENFGGQLGHGTVNIHLSSPTQVGALTDWQSISCGYDFLVAIKTDGTMWSCGYNNNGQLGHGDLVNRSSPTQIGSSTDWSVVSSGFNNSTAIKTDGTIWSWGRNQDGELGHGSLIHRSSPTQIGALTDWSSVRVGFNHVAAIKTNGTLWTWGGNTGGSLGNGATTSRSSPIQIGALTNWLSVVAGNSSTIAIKTDGTLWAWGVGSNGQLGDGTLVAKSSPIQIGTLKNWRQATTRGTMSAAIRTDGTLWTWGINGTGQLGLGHRNSRSSPSQVGSLTKWRYVAAAQQSVPGTMLAIAEENELLPIENGGTGQQTPETALLALMPPYNGPTKYVLTTNGQNVYWAPISSLP